MNPRLFLLILFALAAAIILGDAFTTRRGSIHQELGEAVQKPGLPEPLPPHMSAVDAALATASSAELVKDAESSPPPIALEFGAPAWRVEAESVQAQKRDAGARANALLEMLPRQPVEAKAELASEAVNELPDANYAQTALPLVTNPTTAGEVLSVLFADLMERPDAITLPALLQIARSPQHPFAPAALDNLRLLLRVDRGTDWPAWAADVQRRLAK